MKLEERLRLIGLGDTVSVYPVSGGSINTCYDVRTTKGRWFAKCRKSNLPSDLFEKEAAGLEQLRQVNEVKVPAIIHSGDELLLLEFVESAPRQQSFSEEAGRSIASIHSVQSDSWGNEQSNYMGALKQVNTKMENGAAFFLQHRMTPWVNQTGVLRSNEELDSKRVIETVTQIIADDPPVLLHGDLWSGNLLTSVKNETVVFDPAVYFGHPHIDIAMTDLFGGFDEHFYSAYEECSGKGLPTSHEIRMWNVYPLLIHAVLFGGTYIEEVRTTMRYFGWIKEKGKNN